MLFRYALFLIGSIIHPYYFLCPIPIIMMKEFGVPAEDLEGLVEAGMQVQRLLVNNMRPVTADDARKLYQEVM